MPNLQRQSVTWNMLCQFVRCKIRKPVKMESYPNGKEPVLKTGDAL